jgi:membrane dipeptidase
MERGGLDFVFFSVAVGQRVRTDANYQRAYDEALNKIATIWRMEDLHANRIAIATSPGQARDIHAAGKLVAGIGIENGFAVGKEPAKLRDFRARGVSYITLVHLGHNDIADSANPITALGDREFEHGGLSELGRTVVAEMNRCGLMIDVSHASKRAMLEITHASEAPVIASHSGVRALVDSERNMDDEQLIALKNNGGVIQIIGYSSYIRSNTEAKNEEITQAAKKAGLVSHLDWVEATNDQYILYGSLLEAIDRRYPRASVHDLVDHIDYVVQLIGIDHVGIGSDFYAGGGAAVGGLSGWMDASESPNITRELLRRGYSEADIAKIWGQNLMRVWSDVVAFSKRHNGDATTVNHHSAIANSQVRSPMSGPDVIDCIYMWN